MFRQTQKLKQIAKKFTILACVIFFSSHISFGSHLFSLSGDTVILENELKDDMIHMNIIEIDVVPDYTFKNTRQERKYSRLEKDVIAAYPTVRIVKREYDRVNSEFSSNIYDDKKHRKAYMKWFEKHIYNTYIDTLKTLSISQGKILLKLIDRETGQSPYKLIKEYRGTGSAIMWRTMALLLGANLNATYDPEEDEMLAHILRRIEAGLLLPPPKETSEKYIETEQ